MGRSTTSTMNTDTDEFWMQSSSARLTPGNLSSTFFMDVFFTLQCQMTLSGGDWRLGHTMMTRSQCTDTHFHILIRIDHKGFWGPIRDMYGTISSHCFFFLLLSLDKRYFYIEKCKNAQIFFVFISDNLIFYLSKVEKTKNVISKNIYIMYIRCHMYINNKNICFWKMSKLNENICVFEKCQKCIHTTTTHTEMDPWDTSLPKFRSKSRNSAIQQSSNTNCPPDCPNPWLGPLLFQASSQVENSTEIAEFRPPSDFSPPIRRFRKRRQGANSPPPRILSHLSEMAFTLHHTGNSKCTNPHENLMSPQTTQCASNARVGFAKIEKVPAV